MNILFCGTIVPEAYDTKLKYLSPAANRFQINFCRELLKQGHDLKILSYIGFPIKGEMPDFSKDVEFFSGLIDYTHKAGELGKSVKVFSIKLMHALQKADVVITYNVVYAWLIAPYQAGKLKVKSALILADYSEACSYQSFLKKLYARLQLSYIRKCDYVMGLSENAKQFLKKKQIFYCMEGGISEAVYGFFEVLRPVKDEITFMYSGLLEEVTGINILLEAFHGLDAPHIRLCITGKGSLGQKVAEYAAKDSRIINLGYLEYNVYLSQLSEADVLVNPRNMNLPENKNNFPSKIMEYLAVGKTILSTKFAGYEKFSHVISFCESTVPDMRKEMTNVIECCREEREELHRRNREFAARFLWSSQVKGFIDMIR